jgi:hypothetical protein
MNCITMGAVAPASTKPAICGLPVIPLWRPSEATASHIDVGERQTCQIQVAAHAAKVADLQLKVGGDFLYCL